MDLNKDRLRTAYNEVVAKIDAKRNGLLSGTLYKRMQELVFETAYAALLDTASLQLNPASSPLRQDIQAIHQFYHDHT
jgi:hypothetical protein